MCFSQLLCYLFYFFEVSSLIEPWAYKFGKSGYQMCSTESVFLPHVKIISGPPQPLPFHGFWRCKSWSPHLNDKNFPYWSSVLPNHFFQSFTFLGHVGLIQIIEIKWWFALDTKGQWPSAKHLHSFLF